MLPELLRLQFLNEQTDLSPSETEELTQLQHLHNLRLSIINHDRISTILTQPVIPKEFTETQQAKIIEQNHKLSVRHTQYADAVTELYQAYHTLWLQTALPNAAVRGPAVG